MTTAESVTRSIPGYCWDGVKDSEQRYTARTRAARDTPRTGAGAAAAAHSRLVALTLTHRQKSNRPLVTGQAPITLECIQNTSGKKKQKKNGSTCSRAR